MIRKTIALAFLACMLTMCQKNEEIRVDSSDAVGFLDLGITISALGNSNPRR